MTGSWFGQIYTGSGSKLVYDLPLEHIGSESLSPFVRIVDQCLIAIDDDSSGTQQCGDETRRFFGLIGRDLCRGKGSHQT